MPGTIDILFACVFAILWPAWSYFVDWPRHVRAVASGDPMARTKFFRQTIVEQWALAAKKNQNTGMFGMQLRRAATPLVGLLKPMYGLLADQVSGMILVATRNGNDTARVRSLREGVGLLRQAIEIQQNKVKADHSVEIALADE